MIKKSIAIVRHRLTRSRSQKALSGIATAESAAPAITRRYTVGVIGAGAMGREHLMGLKTVPHAEIAALVDPRPERLELMKTEQGLTATRMYTDAEDMLRKEQLDLVIVATNTTSHAELAIRAIEAGAPRVVVEKPVSNQIDKARHLLALAQERGVKVAVNHNRRWSRDYRAVRRAIDQGYIGTLRQLYAAPSNGGLGMIGSHYFDIMTYLAGSKLAWVIGSLDEVVTPNKRGAEFVDPGGYTLMGFENGTRGYLDVSDDLGQKNMLIVLRGDAGRIEIDERAQKWTVINDLLDRASFPFIDSTKISRHCANLCVQMLSDAPVPCTIEDGISALEAVMATHLSAAQGSSKITLPLVGEGARLELALP